MEKGKNTLYLQQQAHNYNFTRELTRKGGKIEFVISKDSNRFGDFVVDTSFLLHQQVSNIQAKNNT